MTLWKQGASAVPVLARLRIIFGSAGIGIGRACCPIGTALVTEFAPRRIRATMIVMGVVGVALPRMIRSRARTGTADAPCFQRVISLFSLCYLLLEKLSKSLITLSDCPFVLNRLPVILGKSPCFRFETGNFRRCKSASRRLLVCCACGDRGARQMAGSPGTSRAS